MTERKSITVSADTKAALDDWKDDDETWDEFMRSLLAEADGDSTDATDTTDVSFPSADDIATMTAQKTAEELEDRLRR